MNYKIFFLFVFVLLTSFSNIPKKPIDNLKITETIKLPGSKVISSYNELNANSYKTPSFESYSIALEGFYKLKEKGLPYEGIAFVLGNSEKHWYRLCQSLGRVSLVGSTVKRVEKLPLHLVADEKHSECKGKKSSWQ